MPGYSFTVKTKMDVYVLYLGSRDLLEKWVAISELSLNTFLSCSPAHPHWTAPLPLYLLCILRRAITTLPPLNQDFREAFETDDEVNRELDITNLRMADPESVTSDLALTPLGSFVGTM